MPTARGWSVLGAGLGLVVLWVVFGELELLAVGAATALAVPMAAAWVRLSAPTITVDRSLIPSVTQAGGDVRVRLSVTNHGRVPVSTAHLSDPIPGLGTAGATLARLDGRSTAAVPYRLVARRRGIFSIGPAALTVQDPLGLASVTRVAGPRDTLVVHPRLEPMRGVPVVRGRDPSTDAVHPEFASRGGEDFYTIREYRQGDDLRRVHWPTTARIGELMIRQLETPWQSRGLVLLDTRAQVYDEEAAFETAVRGAASIFDHLRRAGFELDLLAGSTRVRASDPGARSRAMEVLAGVTPNPALDVLAVASRLRAGLGGGALIVITGTADDRLLRAARLLASDHASVAVAAVTRAPIGAAAVPGTRTSVAAIAPDEPWAVTWDRMQGRAWAGA
ncbi:MAG: DUF58 domain-containing protein [Acidimicrobiia bacterium]